MEKKSGSFRKRYYSGVENGLKRFSNQGILTRDSIKHLPSQVQKYLIYTGAVGKEKLHNVRICFAGEMSLKQGGKWMKFESEQYNFFDIPERLFYIKAKMFGVPVTGLHTFTGNDAVMEIKVASLLKVVDARGDKMNQGETVTVFNDMCMMAPASLIDKNIKWETIDDFTVKAYFTKGNITISADLIFNETGQLVDFISNDRFMSSDGKTYHSYKWSTPVGEYTNTNGINLPLNAKAVWHMPEGEYCYGKFKLKNIEYNCR